MNQQPRHDEQDELAAAEKRYALDLLAEAFAEGRIEGLDPDCLAHAAIFSGFEELVSTYGEDAAAAYAESLVDRIRSGGFSTALRH
ncbi:hypothetical protein [Salinarimonas chemoclinalis]|uniref:hypothetical protein n=1 Tax=Salinarimonas chemoclinalis TaxID=3241599 RepID=UPI00355848AF